MKKQNLFPILHLLTPNDRVYIQIALRHFPNGVYKPAHVELDLPPPIPFHAIPLVERNLALRCVRAWMKWAAWAPSVDKTLQKLEDKLSVEFPTQYMAKES